MKARYPSYMKHSHVWKFILLGLLIVILVPFGLFALGNVVASHYNGLDYPWHYPDTVWRSEEPRAEIAVDGDKRATLHMEVDGEMRPFTFHRKGRGVYIYRAETAGEDSETSVLVCSVDTASEDVLRLKIEKEQDDLYHGAYKYITFRRVAG
mgnify:CR=1 FL=1